MSVHEYQTKKGRRYYAKFRVVENGREVHKTLRGFTTKTEARQQEFEYKRLAAEKERTRTLSAACDDSDSITFGDVYNRFEKWAIDNLAPSTSYSYINIAKNHILPEFQKQNIKSITRLKLSDWLETLPSNLSYKTKKNIRTCMSSILSYATEKEFFETNPMSNAGKLHNDSQSQQIEFWTNIEFNKFIKVVDNKLYKALFSFIYAAGCRKGEAFALLWTDIDFENKMVNIDKSLTKKGQVMAKKHGKKIKQQTKNKKAAKIYMPQSVLDLIDKLPRGKYVFGGDKPLAETTVARHFDKYINLAGVKKIRLHDLRHSCAALIISSTDSELTALYAIAERLRDTPEMILKTYGHLFPSRQREVNKMLDKTFNGIESKCSQNVLKTS